MINLLNPLLEIEEYTRLLSGIENYSEPVNITGLSESRKAHVCSALCRHSGRRGVFIAYNEMQARKLYDDFSLFMGEDVIFYPNKEIMLYDVEAKSHDIIYQRVAALDRIMRGDFAFVVTSAEAASHKLVHPDVLRSATFEAGMSGSADIGDIARRLLMMGYERVETVERRGQFAIRGGIVDVFPVDGDTAARLELFGDEIDSIRKFDVNTQRSTGKMESLRVIPAREIIFAEEEKEDIIRLAESDLAVGPTKSRGLARKIGADMDRLREEWYFPGIDRYIPYIARTPFSLADYLAHDALIFIDEPERHARRLENLALEHAELCRAMMEKEQLMPRSFDMFFSFDGLCAKLEERKTICLNAVNSGGSVSNQQKTFDIPGRSVGSFLGNVSLLEENLSAWKKEKYRVLLLAGTRGRGERMRDMLVQDGVEAMYADRWEEPLMPGQVVITRGSLHRGFEYPTIKFAVISGEELFGQDARRRTRTAGKRKGQPISLFTDLNVGDYVVHQAHGIGQYIGIEKLSVEGVKKDYLKIRYLDGAFLYIPTNQVDLIQKYIGTEGKQPKVNKLGGTEWIKTKNKVKESVREMAAGLIELYARRQAVRGFAYSKDTVWQKQFEEQFPYEETEDQLKCIEEIKEDMESGRVMDRLLCGDVGYGKTEVAIRAIFKAVMDGRQVAYLVPTTVLAQQHYNNFAERFRDFPVSVEVISRFRTKAEQKRILKELKAGNVDVLIGTHRLLQKDIHFKNLGLLVIDEEHRFGVFHKERLKNLAPDVDVLTLTATPIPRTLHMSLAGIRDISVIEDPPEDRYPVQTYVMEYNRDVVKDAIARELGRRGQVFYLYNRVRSIDVKAFEIQSMVPGAKVAVAHGQMDERQLEDIMLDFIKGNYDILVCTTIIESGLDMPNVNTIIVEDADKLGLAQLYQLRGRVGRSGRLAYAYITYRKDKVVSEIAEKRLQAIKELTELGSGFKIAMRDMEIRGAGNLLGPEQHGHMESVGYEMYCRLLEEAVRELKGLPREAEEPEITIDINVDAYIDDSYIGVESRKIEMYKKIAAARDEQDLQDIKDELEDRYGEMPEPVGNLVMIAHIKVLARSLGISSVTEKNGTFIFNLSSAKNINFRAISRITEKYRRQLLFNAGMSPYISYRPPHGQKTGILDNIKILLQELKSYEAN